MNIAEKRRAEEFINQRAADLRRQCVAAEYVIPDAIQAQITNVRALIKEIRKAGFSVRMDYRDDLQVTPGAKLTAPAERQVNRAKELISKRERDAIVKVWNNEVNFDDLEGLLS